MLVQVQPISLQAQVPTTQSSHERISQQSRLEQALEIKVVLFQVEKKRQGQVSIPYKAL